MLPMTEKKNNPEVRAQTVLTRLKERYPQTRSALDWEVAWELLTATVLAAQCTDERVNKVTPELFRRWPTLQDMAGADVAEVEEVVHSTGFFRQKAKNLIASARLVMEHHNGELPRTMAELTTLPGVARKTANIVLSNAFGIHEGIAVDTHVKRLSFRLGLTKAKDPVRIEQDLIPLIPREEWGEINHLLVYFGREVCNARSPKCDTCPLGDFCPRYGVA
jgi:endonuclease III